MKLADYMHANGVTPSTLRKVLGLRSRSSVARYLTGQRIPEPKILQRIIELTRGQVQLADFLNSSPPRCAAIVRLPNGRSVMVFPWTNRDAELDACLTAANDDAPQPPEPVRQAMNVLGPRVRMHGEGLFLLDGRLLDQRRLVQAANRQLDLAGKLPIVYPGAMPSDPS